MISKPASGVTLAVSIVIPVFNGADTIGRALDSVLAQTFRDFEIVIVDDGSTDDLSKALAPFADAAIRLHRHDANRGAAAARNTGARDARGRYIAFLDADDEWLPSKLEWQVEVLETARDGEEACCTSYVMLRDDGAAPIRNRRPKDTMDVALADLLLGCNLSPGSTLMVRRGCFHEIGPFDEALRRLEDWDWLIRYASSGRSVRLGDRPLARIHSLGIPATTAVLDAVKHLYGKHVDGGSLPVPGHIRRFYSALMLEQAAAYYRYGKLSPAIFYTLRSILAYPSRNGAFFLRMADRLLRAIFRRGMARETRAIHEP